jgi:Zn-dependent oligopeptidase
MLFDYSTVNPETVRRRASEAIEAANRLVAGVVDPATPSSYDGILAPLDRAAAIIAEAYGATAFMGYVHPDAETRNAGKEVEEALQKWGVEVVFRDDLYAAVRAFSTTPEAASLAGERARFLEFSLRDLRKAGHELPPEVRAEVKELTQRLVELGVVFEQNIAEHEDQLTVDRSGLEGLPDSYVEGLKPADVEGSYQVTMAYPDVIPFLENASRRDLRERLMFKFNTRAVEPNRPLLEEAVRIRQTIADRFNAPSWAHHVLEERMAKSPEAVDAFYHGLVPPLQEKARDEIRAMTELLEGDPPLQVWDWRYLDTQLRKRDYGVDPMEVASYFPLQQVLDGMLDLTGEMFGLSYQVVESSAWHPDVITYAIHDRADGHLISHFYMDLFPREGKFSHAAAFPLVPGYLKPDGSYQRPVSAIVANLTKPTADRPSLLQHQEVETLFHEFGHILHQTLTRAELVRFSGTATERDFVEAPSQIMENWTWQAPVLRRFARHYQTGEAIPDRLVDQLVAARNLNIAIATLRQVQFGLLDMGYHGPEPDKDLDRVLRRASEVALLPFQEGTFMPAAFGHLFGYDAGYYGYLWSEVFGDDMWSRFETEGIVNPEVGAAYRRAILERGGTRDGGDLLRDFLGREPSNQAFLHRLGID